MIVDGMVEAAASHLLTYVYQKRSLFYISALVLLLYTVRAEPWRIGVPVLT